MQSRSLFLALALILPWVWPISAQAKSPSPSAKALVNLKIEGGFAAGIVHLDVTVDTAGIVHASGHGKSSTATLPPADFAAFKDALEAVKWSTLPAQMRMDPHGMDMPFDKIDYFGGSKVKSVTLQHFPYPVEAKAPANLVRVFGLLAAVGDGALGDENPADVKLSVDAKPGAEAAKFALHVRNTSDRAVALPITHFGGVKFVVKHGAETVYDSEANKYYALFVMPPALHLLEPGADWTVDGSWNYVHNVWGSDDRSRVPGGVYKVQGVLSLAGAQDAGATSAWTAFEVPADEMAKRLQLKLTKRIDPDAGTVKLTLKVTNIGKQSLTLAFPMDPTYAIEIVEAKSGKVVFRGGDGMPSPLKLKPGASGTFTTEWDGTSDPAGKKLHGAFTAVARLFTEPERRSNTIAFVLDPTHAAAADGGDEGPGILEAMHHAADGSR